jgi:hypothetical protein
MELKTTQRWQLQDLLHAAGAEPITQSDYGDHDGDALQARIESIKAELVGKVKTVLDVEEKTGLPKCLSDNERQSIFRALAIATRGFRGSPPTLLWAPPITCATQMKRSLEDRQVHEDDDRRYRTVTLRAQPYFQHRPSRDNVKVWIEEDAGRKKLYFAMYVTKFTHISPIYAISN